MFLKHKIQVYSKRGVKFLRKRLTTTKFVINLWDFMPFWGVWQIEKAEYRGMLFVHCSTSDESISHAIC